MGHRGVSVQLTSLGLRDIRCDSNDYERHDSGDYGRCGSYDYERYDSDDYERYDSDDHERYGSYDHERSDPYGHEHYDFSDYERGQSVGSHFGYLDVYSWCVDTVRYRYVWQCFVPRYWYRAL